MRAERHPAIHGLMAEFAAPDGLVEAIRAARREGYRRLDAYTPYPIEEVSEALELPRSKMPLIVLVGGLLGLSGGYGLQYWVNAWAYPMNVGGRPIHSWPAFIIPTFEMTILFAALFAVLGMFALNGLPQPYHPVFNVPRFAAASRDRYFLVIEAADPKFDRGRTADFLRRLEAREVAEVES
jgi:hypothetical protein